MSNTRNLKFKKIFCSIVLCLGILFSAFFSINTIDKYEVNAAIKDNIVNDVSADLLNSHHDFYTNSSSKPASVNGWSAMTDSSVNNDSEHMVKGIVDLKDETTFSTSTYHTSKPNMPKDKDPNKAYFKNLMINSYNGAGRLGYKSNSISLDSDSFYAISVKLYTHRTQKSDKFEETDPKASIYLTGLTDDEKYEDSLKFENINTNQSWEEYTFYIDTNESKSVNLELWLGSKTDSIQGAVFFNYVKIIRYSEDYYRTYIANDEKRNADDLENNYNLIELSNEKSQPVKNSSFETTAPIDWKKIAQSTTGANGNTQRCEIVDVNNFKLETEEKTILSPGSNCSLNNSLALFLYNKNDGYQALESSTFTIEQLGYYKISFWAKSDANVGTGATVYLVDKTEKNPIEKAKLTLATKVESTRNEYRNNWSQYSFYVYGDEFENKDLSIQIWLGTKEAKTNGYVYIDDFTIQNIDYKTYSNNSSSSNSTSMNFNTDKDTFVVSNFTFNKTNNQNNELKFPMDPADWTKTGSTNTTTFSGIINTKKEHFDTHNSEYTDGSISPIRPSALPNSSNENNNVLMIGSSSEDNTQTYTSNALTLSADSYYKLSFYVFTDYTKPNLQDNLGARVRVTSSTRTIYDCFNIFHDDASWHKYEINIKTGPSSEEAKIELKFENLTGYVFFDQIALETSNKTLFETEHKYPEIKYFTIDLTKENFDNRTFNKFEELQSPNNWTGKEQDDLSITESGIVSTSYDRINDYPNTISGNKNVLYILSLHNVNYAYTGKTNYSFEAKQYYKVSVNVLTDHLIVENSLDKDISNYGITIGLDKSKELFYKGINTNGVWQTCTLYICLEEELVSPITLSLGAKDEKISGLALFDDLKIEKIDKSQYLKDIKENDNSYTKSFINYIEKEEEKTEETPWNNDFNWLVVPSIITGVALIMAIAGFYIRKINFTRKPKIKTKYDRRKTLDKDIDRKEKIALRKQIIEELNQELLSIDKEIAEYQKLAEEQLNNIKAEIEQEKEEIKRKKLEIEIKKKEAKANREKELKSNPELITNKKAESDFEKLISKLDKQEMNLQKQINQKDVKIANTKELDKNKLAKYLERKEFIKNEIAKIEAEIEEIAKEEAEMWEEYKLAKKEAKQKKAEYKEQLKIEKENKKKDSLKTKTSSQKNESNKDSDDKKPTKKQSNNKKK